MKMKEGQLIKKNKEGRTIEMKGGQLTRRRVVVVLTLTYGHNLL